MKNKLICLTICFLFFILSSNASLYDHKSSAKELMKALPAMDNIECKFKQEKILKNIQKPLISGGNFKFDKSKGVFFETTYPVKTVTSYTGKDYEQINNIILAISQKQYSKLDKTFDFYYQNTDEGWMLGLKPKDKTGIDRYIETITINGSDYIRKIEIIIKDGSRTTQWFWK